MTTAKTYRLLLCDDHPAADDLISRAISRVEVLKIEFVNERDWAKTLAESLTRVRDPGFPYDIVIADMNFPLEDRLGGLQIVRQLKKRHPFCVVLVWTAFGRDVALDDLMSEGFVKWYDSVWLDKSGSAEALSERTADALGMLEAEIKRSRWSRETGQRPYGIHFDEDERGFMLLRKGADGVSAKWHVTGLNARHIEILRALAEAGRAVGEEALIERIYKARESVSQPLNRQELLDIGAGVQAPVDKCERYLVGQGNCGHYERCFPAGRLTRAQAAALPKWNQCPLHYRLVGAAREIAPQRKSTDIAYIRRQVAACVGSAWEPLARTGGDNDLIRRTSRGYFLAAEVLD
jgi:CheY-like chemotaxis protein